MGRKDKEKNRKHPKDWDAEDEDGNSEEFGQYANVAFTPSPALVSATETGENDNGNQENDNYYDALEKLNEKKASSRLKGLQEILGILQSGGVENFPLDSLDTLNLSLVKFIRRPTSSSEATEAMKVVSVLSLILGPNDQFVDTFSRLFVHIITRVEDDTLRAEALKCLAFINYVSSTDHSDSAAWALSEQLILLTAEGLEVPADLRGLALKFWCLLASVINPEIVLEHSRDGVFEAAVEILDDANTEGKVIAAESFAFLWEVASDSNPEGDAAAWEGVLCDNTRECQRVIAILETIGKDSSKKIAKKEKRERKGTMRMVLDWITEGLAPQEILELRGTELEINTFSSLQQVAMLREVLGDGFQSCLRSFPCTRSSLLLVLSEIVLEISWRSSFSPRR
jgi:uncharacterized protein (UPF0147 family)